LREAKMARARDLLLTLAQRVDPRHAAVVVVDMQNDYVSPGGATDKKQGNVAEAQAIIPNLRSLLAAARASGTLVVYVCMALDQELELLPDIEYHRRKVRWGDIPVAVKGTWGFQLPDELAPQTGDMIVEKFRSSGFMATNLDMVLRGFGIRSTIITGVVTTGCVESTVRDALMCGYYVTVPSDCVASPDPALHEEGIRRFRGMLGVQDGIVTAQQIIDEWNKRTPVNSAPLVSAMAR
jgi:nicotinamidase-related amidase